MEYEWYLRALISVSAGESQYEVVYHVPRMIAPLPQRYTMFPE